MFYFCLNKITLLTCFVFFVVLLFCALYVKYFPFDFPPLTLQSTFLWAPIRHDTCLCFCVYFVISVILLLTFHYSLCRARSSEPRYDIIPVCVFVFVILLLTFHHSPCRARSSEPRYDIYCRIRGPGTGWVPVSSPRLFLEMWFEDNNGNRKWKTQVK